MPEVVILFLEDMQFANPTQQRLCHEWNSLLYILFRPERDSGYGKSSRSPLIDVPLFRRPRKGVCHHISRSLSDSSRHPTAGTCPLLWGPCVNKEHAVSDPDTAPRQSASCLVPKTPISLRQSASLVSFCAIILHLARFDAFFDASKSTLSPPRLQSCFLCVASIRNGGTARVSRVSLDFDLL